MAMPSLFEKMATLYGKRNRARDKFARIDNRKKVGVDDPDKFAKWKSAAQDVIDAEKELMKSKWKVGNYPFSTNEDNLASMVYKQNAAPIRAASDKYRKDLYNEYLKDWFASPNGQKWLQSGKTLRIELPYEAEKILEDNHFDRKVRQFEDEALNIDDLLKSAHNVAGSLSKDYKKIAKWDDNLGMPGIYDINFTDKKGVSHNPMEYYYGASFKKDFPWHKGKGLSDEDIRILNAFD